MEEKTLKWIIEQGLDEVAAMVVLAAGLLYLFSFGSFQEGMSLVSIGTSYLFGKSMPKK